MDTKFFYEALRNWQERNHTLRTWDRLTPAQQSEIMLDAQKIKKNSPQKPPLTIDDVLGTRSRMSPEGLRNLEACERILRRRSS